MENVREVRYLTDDRDETRRRNELVISFGGNGDWYVAVVPEGQEGTIGHSVRICTSGGASSAVPGLAPAIADMFRALLSAGEGRGVRIVRIRDEEDGDPACDIRGRCVAPKGTKGVTNCKFCGKELQQGSDGKWYTWDADLLTDEPQPQDEE